MATTPSKEPSSESRFLKALRGYFLTGIVVTAPVGLSLYFVWALLTWVDEKVTEIVPIHVIHNQSIPGFGVIVAVAFFMLVGLLTRNFIGQLLLDFSNYIMERVPVVKTIYGALKQVLEMVMGQQAQAFRDVVLVEWPREGMFMMGFLTGKTEGEVQNLTTSEVVNVFIPTTPNPTSGFLVFVPADKVKTLNMSVDEGLKMIISGGMITPKYEGGSLPPVIPSADN